MKIEKIFQEKTLLQILGNSCFHCQAISKKYKNIILTDMIKIENIYIYMNYMYA